MAILKICFVYIIAVISTCYAYPATITCEHNSTDGRGVYIAEVQIYYPCKYLREIYPEDRYIGIYGKRDDYCKDPTTDCCETCAEIRNSSDTVENTSTPRMVSPEVTATTVKTTSANVVQESTESEELQDTCENGCLEMGELGALGTCDWLLQPERSAYELRFDICNMGFARRCARTCREVLRGVEGQTSSNGKPAETNTDCTDSHLMVDKISHDCSDLINVNSAMYSDRASLCESDEMGTVCCLTCRAVKNEKPSVVIKYNEENALKKNDNNVIASINEESETTNQRPAIPETNKGTSENTNTAASLLNVVNSILENLRKVEDGHSKLISNMFSLLQRIALKENP